MLEKNKKLPIPEKGEQKPEPKLIKNVLNVEASDKTQYQ